MQLEFHQLDRRWEHLRVREPQRQRRLLASLADSGQQTPIVVVAAGPPNRYLVIDGYKRVAALEQLGRDTVEATLWAMSEAEAVLLSRSLRFSPQESALEQGWLLAEREQRFGYGLEELARRFDRSPSWVSRRLALVELLPEAIQQQVREGKLAAQAAMKYLVPVARVNAGDCTRMAAAFVAHRCTTRQAGQLYRVTQGTCGAVRRSDRVLAAQLHQRGVPIEAVENAFVLAAARRMIRPAVTAPLGTIRSLAYFSPVIEEVLQLQVGQEYFQHLRNRLQRAASAR